MAVFFIITIYNNYKIITIYPQYFLTLLNNNDNLIVTVTENVPKKKEAE